VRRAYIAGRPQASGHASVGVGNPLAYPGEGVFFIFRANAPYAIANLGICCNVPDANTKGEEVTPQMEGTFGGYTRWAVVFLIIFVLFFLLVPSYTQQCTTVPVY